MNTLPYGSTALSEEETNLLPKGGIPGLTGVPITLNEGSADAFHSDLPNLALPHETVKRKAPKSPSGDGYCARFSIRLFLLQMLLIVVVGLGAFSIYEYVTGRGPTGKQGDKGEHGTDGIDGTNGIDGVDGVNGLNGTNGRIGQACWDYIFNGICDPSEDRDGDGNCTVFDCNFVANSTNVHFLQADLYLVSNATNPNATIWAIPNEYNASTANSARIGFHTQTGDVSLGHGDSTEFLYGSAYNGYVGFNDTHPTHHLSLAGIAPWIKFNKLAANTWYVGPTSTYFKIGIDGTLASSFLTISNAGFVGISQDIPTYPLHVAGTFASSAALILGHIESTVTVSTNAHHVRGWSVQPTINIGNFGAQTFTGSLILMHMTAGTGVSGTITSHRNINAGTGTFTMASGTTSNLVEAHGVDVLDPFTVTGSGTLTAVSKYGLRVRQLAVSGYTLTDQYAAHLYQPTGATNNYALYVDGTSSLIQLDAATSNMIMWRAAGSAVPSLTTRSAGTKLVLAPTTDILATTVDTAIGVETNAVWHSVPASTYNYKFYAGTSAVAAILGTGQLLVGSATKQRSSSTSEFQVSGTYNEVTVLAASTTAANGGFLTLARSRGAIGSLATVSSADVLGSVQFSGYDGTAWSDAVLTQTAITTETWTTSAHGTALVWEGTPTGSITRAQWMKLIDGKFGIGTNNVFYTLSVGGILTNTVTANPQAVVGVVGVVLTGVAGQTWNGIYTSPTLTVSHATLVEYRGYSSSAGITFSTTTTATALTHYYASAFISNGPTFGNTVSTDVNGIWLRNLYTANNAVGTFTVPNKYGIKIDTQTSTGHTTTNYYGLYIDTTTSATNNFGAVVFGKVGFGIAAPTSLFHLSGSLAVATDTIVAQSGTNLSPTVAPTGSGTVTDSAALYIVPTFTKGSIATWTNAYGAHIATYSLAATNNYGLYVALPTSGTNNYGVVSMGPVGVGTSAPIAYLDVSPALTNAAGAVILVASTNTVTSGSGTMQSILSSPVTTFGSVSNVNMRSIQANNDIVIQASATVTISSIRNFLTDITLPNIVVNTGATVAITFAAAMQLTDPASFSGGVVGTNTVTNKYGLYIDALGSTGSTTTTNTALYISAPTGATNNYGFVNMGTAGFGIAAPTSLLHLSGSLAGATNTLVAQSGVNLSPTVAPTGSGTVTDAAALYVLPTFTKGSIATWTNAYGTYIATYSLAATRNYGLYVALPTTGSTNYAAVFMGRTGIFTSTPTALLHVGGTTATDGTTMLVDSTLTGTGAALQAVLVKPVVTVGLNSQVVYTSRVGPTVVIGTFTGVDVRLHNVVGLSSTIGNAGSFAAWQNLYVQGSSITSAGTTSNSAAYGIRVADPIAFSGGTNTLTSKYGVYIEALVSTGVTTTTNTAIYVDTPTGASDNYAAVLLGKVAINSATATTEMLHVAGNINTYVGGNVGDAGGAIQFGIATFQTYTPMALIKGVLANAPASELQGGIAFSTRTSGSAGQTMTERMRLTHDGILSIGAGGMTTTGKVNDVTLNWAKTKTNDANTYYYLIATLPASTSGTKDHLRMIARVGGYTSQSQMFVDVTFSVRNGFSYTYTSRGTFVVDQSAVRVYSNSGVHSIYIVLISQFSNGAVTILHHESATVQANPTSTETQTTPSGSVVFDTNVPATYPPTTHVSTSGQVGFRTATPTAQWEFVSAGGVLLHRMSTSADSASIGVGNDDYFTNFGSVNLKKYGSATSGTNAGITNANLGMISFLNNDNALIKTNTATLIFATADVERMRISSGGSVGIGSTAPRASLEVSQALTTATLAGVVSSFRLGATATTGNTGQYFIPVYSTPAFTVSHTNFAEFRDFSSEVGVTFTAASGGTMSHYYAGAMTMTTGGFTTTMDVNGLFISNLVTASGGGTFTVTNKIGLKILAQTSTGHTTTNWYGIYIAETTSAANNYAAILLGRVGIQTTTPQAMLAVDGAANINCIFSSFASIASSVLTAFNYQFQHDTSITNQRSSTNDMYNSFQRTTYTTASASITIGNLANMGLFGTTYSNSASTIEISLMQGLYIANPVLAFSNAASGSATITDVRTLRIDTALTGATVTNAVGIFVSQPAIGTNRYAIQVSGTSGVITMSAATSNMFFFGTDGVNGPSANGVRATGTKLILYPAVAANSLDYAFGVGSGFMWQSVPTTAGYFVWNTALGSGNNVQQIMKLDCNFGSPILSLGDGSTSTSFFSLQMSNTGSGGVRFYDGSGNDGALDYNRNTRVMTFTSGGVAVATLTSSVLTVNGDIVINTLGKTVSIKSGTNKCAGLASLSSGTVDVSTTCAAGAATELVFVSLKTPGGTSGTHYKASTTSGHVLITSVGTDGNQVNTDSADVYWWLIKNPT